MRKTKENKRKPKIKPHHVTSLCLLALTGGGASLLHLLVQFLSRQSERTALLMRTTTADDPSHLQKQQVRRPPLQPLHE